MKICVIQPHYSFEGKDGFYNAVDAFGPALMEKAAETARRCHAIVCVNAGYRTAEDRISTAQMIWE